MRAFELGEHRVFFGRNREITQIAELLRSPAERAAREILAVVGPSGCGKSSLIRAGVLPRIADEDYWLPLPPMVPGTDPVGSVARAVAAAVRERRIPFDVTSLRKELTHDGLHVVATDLLVAAGAHSQSKLLIVIDQFEELLTQAEPNQRKEFVATLEPALGGPVQGLATLRPEFLDALLTDPDLSKLKLGLHQVLPLESEALREVIEEPAKVAGLSFEPDLVSRVVTDTGSGEALPLLAFTLQQLADGVKRGGQLSHQRYTDIGGVQGALERQADAALLDACANTGMSHDQVISALLNLVTIDEQGRPTKRRDVFDESVQTAAVLEPFVNRRLLSTEAVGEHTFVVVSHDAFLVKWPPLKHKIDQQIVALRARRLVENAAKEWVDSGRDNGMLLHGRQLAKAAIDTGAELKPVESDARSPSEGQRQVRLPKWWLSQRRLATRVEFNDIGHQFLEASIRDYVKGRRRRRIEVFGAIGSLLILALVFIGLFFQAQHARNEAKIAEDQAVAQNLIAQSRDMLLNGPDTQRFQQLLAGRHLISGSDETQFYPMIANSAATLKIMENPPPADNSGLQQVQSVAVSRDGRRIASGSTDQTVQVWDADTGSPLHELHLGGTGSVWSVAFSPDPAGKWIAVGSQHGEDDGTLQLWDADSGIQMWTKLIPHAKTVNSVAFSRDGRWVATGSGDGALHVWEAASGIEKFTRPPQRLGTLRSVAFSPTEDVVAAGGDDYTVRLWDVNGQRVAETPVGKRAVTSVGFSSKGDRLVVGRLDGTIEVLNGRTLEPLGAPIPAHPNTVRSVAFSPDPDSTRIVSGGDDNTVKVWDASSHGHIGNPLRGHRGTVSSVAFTSDGTRIISGSFDGSVRVWDAVLGLPIQAGQGGAIRSVAFSPNTSRMVIASGGTDGTVKLWDASTAAQIGLLGRPSDGTTHAINGLAFDTDGGRIATASTDGHVVVWDVKEQKTIADLAMIAPAGEPPLSIPRVQSVAFNKDGTRIVAGGFDGVVRLWDARSFAPIEPKTAHKVVNGQKVPYQVWSVAFSPDGRVVSGSGFDRDAGQNNLLQLWNVDPLTPNGPPIEIDDSHDANVWAVDFNSDGSLIVSGSTDGTAHVWNAANRQQVAVLSGDQNPVYSVAFAHHHDRWIASGAAGGTVRLWDIVDQPPRDTPLPSGENWVHSVAFSPDDRLIVSGSADGNLRLWPAPRDVGTYICGKLTTNMSDKQWSKWVSNKIRREDLCDGLPPARS